MEYRGTVEPEDRWNRKKAENVQLIIAGLGDIASSVGFEVVPEIPDNIILGEE